MDESRRLSNLAWSIGVYVAHAIGCAFGKGKYPENPVIQEQTSLEYIAKNNGKTEEELSQELMLATLMVDAANYELELLDSVSEGDDV